MGTWTWSCFFSMYASRNVELRECPELTRCPYFNITLCEGFQDNIRLFTYIFQFLRILNVSTSRHNIINARSITHLYTCYPKTVVCEITKAKTLIMPPVTIILVCTDLGSCWAGLLQSDDQNVLQGSLRLFGCLRHHKPKEL